MKANDSLNSEAERFDTLLASLSTATNQNNLLLAVKQRCGSSRIFFASASSSELLVKLVASEFAYSFFLQSASASEKI